MVFRPEFIPITAFSCAKRRLPDPGLLDYILLLLLQPASSNNLGRQ